MENKCKRCERVIPFSQELCRKCEQQIKELEQKKKCFFCGLIIEPLLKVKIDEGEVVLICESCKEELVIQNSYREE